ncbi:hypothetical protein D3C79_787610 [compost metagenome]
MPNSTNSITGSVKNAIKKKVVCQSKVLRIYSVTGKPSAAPSGVPSSHNMVARACKRCGKAWRIMAYAIGSNGPSAMPSRMRSVIMA